MSERMKPNGVDEVTEAILSEVMAQGVIPNRETWERYARAAVGVFLRVIDEEVQEWEEMRHGYIYQHETEERRRCVVAIEALRDIRARFEGADDE